MRMLAMALVALATLSWTVAPADARSRTQQTQAQSRTAAAPQTARASATRRATAPQRQARTTQQSRTQTAARSGSRATSRQTAARTTSRSNGRQASSRSTGRNHATAACRGRNCAPARRQVSWQSGLAPATNAQAASCPVGTMATLARGHDDIVRCMPL